MPAEEKDGDATWKKVETQFKSKPASEFLDPCQDFANRSIKCMRRNANDRDLCQDYFQ
ncbi:hypothetical protein AJ80_05400 [Polytolypa hystricis UAMH7299]|uniref:Cytochrome c oxidase-assembly factor COX23, mitochondrial n=1 Tax=Polytolypa hystricis (strain UAMH7299) TaxID=1447883 RepID=A0A2B7Y3Z5_POLH7|nr:hypothetical protein AJ80_05400 [Polytolypa hystricis UAMH7299]